MSDGFPVTAEKLRKLVKKSRQLPVAFGFNAGTADDDDEYLAAHVRKPPDLLGRIAKTEGAGTKAAYGTFVAEGSEVHLTCFQTIPQLAKKFKKYLKVSKITLNVVVFDPDGNMIDSDIEVLEDWFRDQGGDDDEDEDDEDSDVAAMPTAATGTAAPGAFPSPANGQPGAAATQDGGLAARAARIRDLHAKLATLPPAIAQRIGEALAQAAQHLRADRIPHADNVLQQVVAALARAQLATAKARPVPRGPAEVRPRPSGPWPMRMQAALAALRDEARHLPDGVTASIRANFDAAAGAIKAGKGPEALAALKQAQRALRTARWTEGKWNRVRALMESPVGRAVELGSVAGHSDLKQRWDLAVRSADNGDWDAALAAVPSIAAMVRSVAAQGRS